MTDKQSDNGGIKLPVYLGSDSEIEADEKRKACYAAWSSYRDREEAEGNIADLCDFRAGFLYGYDALKAEKDRWRLALESLTPMGSEFVNDLHRCLSWIIEQRSIEHRGRVDAVRDKKRLEAENEAMRAMLEPLAAVLDLAEKALRSGMMPTEYEFDEISTLRNRLIAAAKNGGNNGK